MPLEFLTSKTLSDVRHGFYTRRGGTSVGLFEGLNCALSASDDRVHVENNRALVAQDMDVKKERLVTCNQVHGNQVQIVKGPHQGQVPNADGCVTDRPNIALGVLTADCLPALFADASAGVIGVAHAGWKGARGGVLENTLAAMISLGANLDAINVAFGPTISQENYEVGPEFRAVFDDDDASNARFFCEGRAGRFHFDLPGYCLARLKRAGVAQVEWIGQCTYADPARFFSYRRSVHLNEADYGRLISTIRI